MKIYKVSDKIVPLNPNMPGNEAAKIQQQNAAIQQNSVQKIKDIMEASQGLDAPISKLNELLPGVFNIDTIKGQISSAIQKTEDYYNVKSITGGANLSNFLNSGWVSGTINTITSTRSKLRDGKTIHLEATIYITILKKIVAIARWDSKWIK